VYPILLAKNKHLVEETKGKSQQKKHAQLWQEHGRMKIYKINII